MLFFSLSTISFSIGPETFAGVLHWSPLTTISFSFSFYSCIHGQQSLLQFHALYLVTDAHQALNICWGLTLFNIRWYLYPAISISFSFMPVNLLREKQMLCQLVTRFFHNTPLWQVVMVVVLLLFFCFSTGYQLKIVFVPACSSLLSLSSRCSLLFYLIDA